MEKIEIGKMERHKNEIRPFEISKYLINKISFINCMFIHREQTYRGQMSEIHNYY